eukprot:jgi/Orpsp1_1/1174815/evm.model.c7180000051547.1
MAYHVFYIFLINILLLNYLISCNAINNGEKYVIQNELSTSIPSECKIVYEFLENSNDGKEYELLNCCSIYHNIFTSYCDNSSQHITELS